MANVEDKLLETIQVLNRAVWRESVDGKAIEEWLKGFGQEGLPNTKWTPQNKLYFSWVIA